jgi:hypothetical protein
MHLTLHKGVAQPGLVQGAAGHRDRRPGEFGRAYSRESCISNRGTRYLVAETQATAPGVGETVGVATV